MQNSGATSSAATIANSQSALRTPHSVLHTPTAVAGVVGLLYLAFLAWLWGRFGGNVEAFIHQGTVWLDPDRQGTKGYDGQFYYYIAMHPLHATQFLDLPSIRLERIFYPLLIDLVALGQRPLMPYAMILINWLAVVGGTWGVARLLAGWGRNPWFALSYALVSGIPLALTFDTPEPLAFALVILAVTLWQQARPGETDDTTAASENLHTVSRFTFHVSRFTFHVSPLVLAALAFALALLTREHTAYFVLAYAGAAFLRRDWGGFSAALLAFVPVTLWGIALSVLLGKVSVAQVQPFETIPFITYWVQGNLVDPTPRSAGYALQYIVPTAVFGLLALGGLLRAPLVWLRRRAWLPPSALLLAVLGNTHLMTFLPRLGYQHQVAVSRYMLGLALAAVLWAGAGRPRRLLWLTPLFVLSLLAYAYGLLTHDPAYLW